MKAKDVLKTLNITRPTLTKYVKTGLIRVDSVINGQYNYNEESVKKLLNNEYEDHLISPVKVSSDKDNELVSCVQELVDIFTQLSQLRLLTPQSLSKLENARRIINNIKEMK